MDRHSDLAVAHIEPLTSLCFLSISSPSIPTMPIFSVTSWIRLVIPKGHQKQTQSFQKTKTNTKTKQNDNNKTLERLIINILVRNKK